MCAALFFLFLHPVHDVRARASWQALRWCDEGAYLLASQTVERFQSREGAQEALRCLLEHQERAPDSKGDALSLELEAILTPQLQVAPPPLPPGSPPRSVHHCQGWLTEPSLL